MRARSRLANAAGYPPAMKTFKYQMLRIYGVEPNKHERELNETGKDGWELVGILTRKDDVGNEYAVYYLKKEFVDPA